MMTSTLRDFNRQQERRNVHPEMADVKTGDELLVFTPEDEEDEQQLAEEPETVEEIL